MAYLPAKARHLPIASPEDSMSGEQQQHTEASLAGALQPDSDPACTHPFSAQLHKQPPSQSSTAQPPSQIAAHRPHPFKPHTFADADARRDASHVALDAIPCAPGRTQETASCSSKATGLSGAESTTVIVGSQAVDSWDDEATMTAAIEQPANAPDVYATLIRRCTRLGMSEAAVLSWTRRCSRPGPAIAAAYLLMFAQVLVLYLCFCWGGSATLYSWVRAFGYVGVASGSLNGVLSWRRGLNHHKSRIAVLLGVTYGIALTLCTLSGYMAPAAVRIPFESLLIYTIALALNMYSGFVTALLLLPPNDVGPITSILPLLWTPLVASVRQLDALTDIGLACDLFRKVGRDACGGPYDVGCDVLFRLSIGGAVFAGLDMLLAICHNMLGKKFKTRQDAQTRRLLLLLHVASALCEAGLLSIQGYILLHSEQDVVDVLFILVSALTTVVCFIANLLGIRTLLQMVLQIHKSSRAGKVAPVSPA